MLYLIGQILLCLLLAAAVGFVVGWLVRSVGERSRIQALEGTWRSRLRAVELERKELERRVSEPEDAAPEAAAEASDRGEPKA
jgi:hypothetical protein